MPFPALSGLALAAALAAGPPVPGTVPQYRREFTFVIRTEPRLALELFGADGERVWAGPHWNPRFLLPLAPRDQEGAVFVVSPPKGQPILGTTTVFDREAHRVRHVLVRGHDSVTVIDIRLSAAGPGESRVVVTYERTALHGGAEDEVRALSADDAAQAAEWQAAIDAYLSSRR